MMPALQAAGLGHVRMLLQVHDELVFELPEGDVPAASKVIEAVMAGAAEPAVPLSVPLGVEIGTGPSWGAAHYAWINATAAKSRGSRRQSGTRRMVQSPRG